MKETHYKNRKTQLKLNHNHYLWNHKYTSIINIFLKMNSVDNRTLIKANIKDGNKRTNPILLNKLKKKKKSYLQSLTLQSESSETEKETSRV